ncbi:hypothetical protein HBH70_028580 [Parastagonospora nodorum]|nr:hypothetical protein HBH53_036020 [Parastagonospora nodorum]KAH4000353.1 hypothetical protein HBI10_098940 [Parastagonospora nodorum]KAH4026781.1 hypothetical protein HBI13_066660 [Parastagonospora nodorum]KAH4068389.1 hypothetical protein HBH50_126570 [Parastagonospora nodorum]KAH4078356.1 hypothetical protein HBH48_232160 [Parastagonospora nodorum]
MPIKWTPELDSILLHGVFEECNISFSKALCAKIADRVKTGYGIDCTPKAVENRLYSWKKKNLPAAPSTGNTPSSTPKTPKTPKVRAKATPKKIVLDESEEGGPEGLLESPSPSVKRTSAKRQRSASKVVYVETDGSDVTEKEYIPYGGTKKIKREYAEDEGEVGFATAEEV